MRDIKKVLLISNVPQTYRIPLFNEIDRQFREMGIELKVVFASDGYKRRKSKIDFSEIKFQYEILKSLKFSFGNVEKTMFTYSGINRTISKFKPDKIIVSGFSLASLKIYFRSLFFKVSYVIWSGAIQFPGRFDSVFRKFERRLLIKRASAFVSYGSKAKEYLVSLGAPANRVFIGINTVDTSFFSLETNRIRVGLKPPEKKHLIYIGYLVPRKNVGKLIEIIERLSEKRDDFVLDILGDGSEKRMLEKMVEEKGLNDVVLFHGFVQKIDLPRYFAQGTCFLFQTDFDIWGLVLNEAMAAGVPVISSVTAGATYDLISEGETGFAADYNNLSDVLLKINMILDQPELVEGIRKKAGASIEEKASLAISAKGFVDSVILE